jgi:predicted RNA-binding protein with RPS1 domain
VEPPREEKALDIGGYKLSGIVWQRKQYFALLETPDGLGHILKVNDQLGPNARVKEITKDAVLIEMKEETAARRGQVRTIRLELQQKKEEPQQQQRRQEEPPQRREEEPQQRREELPQKREEPQQNKEGQ